MSRAVSLEVAEQLSPALRRLAEGLEGPYRTAASQAMGLGVKELVVKHLTREAAERHTTAERLGAAPSGFLGQAARAAADGVVQADADGVSLSIRHPAVARAFRAITILPKRGKTLAIPVNALAYNRYPSQFGASAFFIFKSQTSGAAFLALRQEKGAPLLLMYLLVRSVTQAQDRTLMPSYEEIVAAAAARLKQYLRETFQEAGLSSK